MKRKILFSLISIIFMLQLTQASYAAVEIVPSKNGKGTDAIVNTTISNSYLMCQDMKNTGGNDHSTSTAAAKVEEIYKNKDTRFVDVGPGLGKAIEETAGLYGSKFVVNTKNDFPISLRNSLFGGNLGNYGASNDSNAGSINTNTFRPVIWNE